MIDKRKESVRRLSMMGKIMYYLLILKIENTYWESGKPKGTKYYYNKYNPLSYVAILIISLMVIIASPFLDEKVSVALTNVWKEFFEVQTFN